jgi:hypothetical protein
MLLSVDGRDNYSSGNCKQSPWHFVNLVPHIAFRQSLACARSPYQAVTLEVTTMARYQGMSVPPVVWAAKHQQ